MGGGFRRDLPTMHPRYRPAPDAWNSRTREEQQAALNLASMIPQGSVPEGTTRLINALLVSLQFQNDVMVPHTNLRSRTGRSSANCPRADRPGLV